jgi:acetyltransferase-like isoleucine patch superfamily enzyme
MQNYPNYSDLDDVVIADTAIFKHPELCRLGSHIAIDHGFYSTTQMDIKDYVHIGPYVCVIGGKQAHLTLEEFVAIGIGSKFICGSDDPEGSGLFGPTCIPSEYMNQKIIKPIVIKRFAAVSINSIVMPGVTMAEGSFLGPNSFLRKNTKPWTIYLGTPAREIAKRNPGDRVEYAKQLGYDQ